MHLAKEKRRYIVTTFLIGWAHTYLDWSLNQVHDLWDTFDVNVRQTMTRDISLKPENKASHPHVWMSFQVTRYPVKCHKRIRIILLCKVISAHIQLDNKKYLRLWVSLEWYLLKSLASLFHTSAILIIFTELLKTESCHDANFGIAGSTTACGDDKVGIITTVICQLLPWWPNDDFEPE